MVLNTTINFSEKLQSSGNTKTKSNFSEKKKKKVLDACLSKKGKKLSKCSILKKKIINFINQVKQRQIIGC